MILKLSSVDHQRHLGLDSGGNGFTGVTMTIHTGNHMVVVTIVHETLTVMWSVPYGEYGAITDNVKPNITVKDPQFHLPRSLRGHGA